MYIFGICCLPRYLIASNLLFYAMPFWERFSDGNIGSHQLATLSKSRYMGEGRKRERVIEPIHTLWCGNQTFFFKISSVLSLVKESGTTSPRGIISEARCLMRAGNEGLNITHESVEETASSHKSIVETALSQLTILLSPGHWGFGAEVGFANLHIFEYF